MVENQQRNSLCHPLQTLIDVPVLIPRLSFGWRLELVHLSSKSESFVQQRFHGGWVAMRHAARVCALIIFYKTN